MMMITLMSQPCSPTSYVLLLFFFMLTVLVVLSSSANVRNELLESVYIADVSQVKYLLSLDTVVLTSRPPVLVNRVEETHGRTALMYCGYDPQYAKDSLDDNCVRIAKLLYKAGANLTHVDHYGWNALSMAAVRGLTNFADYLIYRGTAIDSRDNTGLTSLMKAAAHGHRDTFEMLVHRGANVSMSDDQGQSALHYTVKLVLANSTYLPVLSVVIKYVPNVDWPVDRDNRTPLMYTAMGRPQSYEPALVLLRAGADPRRADKYGVTATSMVSDEAVRAVFAEYAAKKTEEEHQRWLSDVTKESQRFRTSHNSAMGTDSEL